MNALTRDLIALENLVHCLITTVSLLQDISHTAKSVCQYQGLHLFAASTTWVNALQTTSVFTCWLPIAFTETLPPWFSHIVLQLELQNRQAFNVTFENAYMGFHREGWWIQLPSQAQCAWISKILIAPLFRVSSSEHFYFPFKTRLSKTPQFCKIWALFKYIVMIFLLTLFLHLLSDYKNILPFQTYRHLRLKRYEIQTIYG